MTLSLSIIDGLTKIQCKFFFLLLYSLFLFLSCERRSFRSTPHKYRSEARLGACPKTGASRMLQEGEQVYLMKVVRFYFDLGTSANAADRISALSRTSRPSPNNDSIVIMGPNFMIYV